MEPFQGVCPVPYLFRAGVPALLTSAPSVGRSAPPLVEHVSVARIGILYVIVYTYRNEDIINRTDIEKCI